MGQGLSAVATGAAGLSPSPSGPYGAAGETVQQIHPTPPARKQPGAPRRKRAPSTAPQPAPPPPPQPARQAANRTAEDDDEDDSVPEVDSERRIEDLKHLREEYKRVFEEQMAALKAVEDQLPGEEDDNGELRAHIQQNRDAIKRQFVQLTTDAVRRASAYAWATPVPTVSGLAAATTPPAPPLVNLTPAAAPPPPAVDAAVTSALAAMPPPPPSTRRAASSSTAPVRSPAYGGAFHTVPLDYVKQKQAEEAARAASSEAQPLSL